MLEISQNVVAFAETRYAELAKVPPQFPDVGGQDLYYGGTAYKNTGGIGVQIATEADGGTARFRRAKSSSLPPRKWARAI
ncbi:MAG: hypothetical protein U0703_19155 [Anaerolineae bacterium]